MTQVQQQQLITAASAPFKNVNLPKMRPKHIALVFGVMSYVFMKNIFSFSEDDPSSPEYQLESVSSSSSSVSLVALDEGMNETSSVIFNGIEESEWCLAPEYPPLSLSFEECRFPEFLFRFPVSGDLTTALSFLLKGAIWAYEVESCYFIDEKGPFPAELSLRDSPLQDIDPFLERYLEPLSLDMNHPKVKDAFRWHKFIEPSYDQLKYHEFGEFSNGLLPLHDPIRHKRRDIQSLLWYHEDNIITKKWMVRRFFRMLPKIREIACSRLSNAGLQDEYLALSIQRGENEMEISLQLYIEKAEIAIQSHFGGVAPTILVASYDCSVMEELRQLRQEWRFVGECDVSSKDNEFFENTDTKQWTEEQTDAFYEKTFTELVGMASAKYFIGVSTASDSYWIYFMRHMDAQDDTWRFIDSELFPH